MTANITVDLSRTAFNKFA